MFDTSLKEITAWVHLHPHWAGIITYVVSFCESLAIIGSIIPGSVVMTAIGILAGSEVISLPVTLICAIIGAISGDAVSFWIGSYFREGLKNIWPLWKYPLILEKGQNFFHKHGGKSIFLGRFIGPMRSMIPMVAGMMQMPFVNFFLAAILASACWAVVYILPGVIIGAAATDLSPKTATFLIILVLLVLIAIWLITGLFKFITLRVIRMLHNNINYFWAWMRQHPHLQKFAVFISDPSHPQSYSQLGMCILLSFCTILFVILCLSVNHTALIPHLNNTVFHIIQSARSVTLDKLFVPITMLGQSTVLLGVWVTVLIWLTYKRQWWTLWHWFMNGILAAGAIVLIKHVVHFPRPADINVVRSTGAFPSGHIAFSIAILGFFAYLATASVRPVLRRLVYGPILLLILFITLSRLYLGAHWLTDVIGSILLATIVLLFTIISYRRKTTSQLKLAPLLIIFLLGYGISYATFYHKFYKEEFYAYTPKYPINTISYQSWWSGESKLPLYRYNRLGEIAALLNLQWAAPLPQIKSALLLEGWQEPPNGLVANFINRLTSTNALRHMPVLPQLYNNQTPVLTLIKDVGINKPQVILNLWPSYYQFSDKKTPLWIGNVSYLIIRHPWHSKKLGPLFMQPLPTPNNYLENTLSSFKVQKRQLNSNLIIMKDMLIQYHPSILLVTTEK